MDKQLINFFFEEASKTFAFLVEKYSFSQPILTVDETIHFATVTFMGKNLAVECIFDEREADIDCKIARIIAGKKTIYYAVDENGKRVRESLFDLLRGRGVKERLLTRVGGLELHEQIKITFADFAKMLIKHGQDILDDSPTALEDRNST